MEFLPRTLGTRPRLACEVRAEGVVAARADDVAGSISAVSRTTLAEGVLVPGLRVGNVAAGDVGGAAIAGGAGMRSGVGGRAVVVAAVRKVLEAVCLRERQVTLVVPDAAVRVLLLEFDALPAKAMEALPVVRFRLKKMLPFDADDAAVSYQVMETRKGSVKVVAVAIPREVLAEYEGVVREAGFEPGAVLPSTLAALAGMAEGDAPALLVNAGAHGVTTAIVKAGVLLLHRTVDLTTGDPAAVDGRTGDVVTSLLPVETASLPLVDREGSAEEWAMQEPVRFGDAESATGTAVLERPLVAEHSIQAVGSEVAQAVSVAAAYFEDTLDASPEAVYSAGTMGAAGLAQLLAEEGVGPVPVREVVEDSMLTEAGLAAAKAAGAGGVPRGWLAGVRGALAN
jgi:type IV pilus assembly protein PilM